MADSVIMYEIVSATFLIFASILFTVRYMYRTQRAARVLEFQTKDRLDETLHQSYRFLNFGGPSL